MKSGPSGTKWCNRCATFKDLDEFWKDKWMTTGLTSACKSCIKSSRKTTKLTQTTMNQQKFESSYRGLSSQAKKVYDAVPIVESWSPAQLVAELRRRNSSMSEVRVIMGCLNTLKEGGLVIEPEKGFFRREAIRPKMEPIDQEADFFKTINETTMKEPMSPTPKLLPPLLPASAINPIDRLSLLASRLRDLASDMDTAALDLAEQAEKNDAETAKMRQLQALLKSLG